MDGLAWLAQATLFVMLGLLVSPAGVLDRAAEALAIAAFLMLVARPLAVFGGLWKFNYSLREKAYISWLGLRGRTDFAGDDAAGDGRSQFAPAV